MSDLLKQVALAYHRCAPAGKISVTATKPLLTQRDLALAYSPGAAACEAILADPREVATLTARANLVGVITNGTAARSKVCHASPDSRTARTNLGNRSRGG